MQFFSSLSTQLPHGPWAYSMSLMMSTLYGRHSSESAASAVSSSTLRNSVHTAAEKQMASSAAPRSASEKMAPSRARSTRAPAGVRKFQMSMSAGRRVGTRVGLEASQTFTEEKAARGVHMELCMTKRVILHSMR